MLTQPPTGTEDLLADLLERGDSDALLAEFPERGERITFAAAAARARRRAEELLELGAEPGARVVIALGNEPAFLDAWFATQLTRSVAVVVDPNLTPEATAEIVERTRPVATISAAGTERRPDAGEPLLPPAHDPERYDPREIATVLFTGGTTGNPKGILLSRRFLWTFADQWTRSLAMTPDDVHLLDLPYCHANGLILGLGGSLRLGRPCVVYPRFSASRYWQRVEQAQPTTASWIGGMSGIIAKHPAPDANPLERVLCIPRPADPAAVEQRFGVRLIETWGATEAGIACWIDPERREPGFGPAKPPYEITLRGEDGQPVAPGEPGELVVRATEPLWMCSGFWRDDELAVAWDGIPRHETGDLVVELDGGGHAFLGRTSGDLIRHRGHNIAAATIENAVLAHDDVLEAAAVGVPAEVGEFDVLVAYTTRAGAGAGEAELLRFLEGRLAAFEVPRYLAHRTSLPETVKHTVKKRELVELQASAWDAEAHRDPVPDAAR